jgi:hypothetical protein
MISLSRWWKKENRLDVCNTFERMEVTRELEIVLGI